MSRRKKNESESSGAPAWMTTFSDMVTLLLTFFILLYSISNVDAKKFEAANNSLQSVLAGKSSSGILNEESAIITPPQSGEELTDLSSIDEKTLEMYDQVKGYVEEQGLEAAVSVSANRDGVFVDIKELILFEPGEVSIKPEGKQILDHLEGLFLQFENRIVVEGHTDNVPTGTIDYPTNWELSADRAVNVVRYLSEVKKIPENRLAAIGYGEFRPMAANDTAANRALNRRVNLLIIMDEGEES
jgi:chemotaxis protein MotB